MLPFEVWEDPTTKVRFCFSHSDETLTTGVMIIPPKTELPKHNRPLAYENLVQITGKCVMEVFSDNGSSEKHELGPGAALRMEKGQFHIHANPYDEVSYTLFKAEGDITSIVQAVRENFVSIELQ